MASEAARKAKWDRYYASASSTFWARIDRREPDECWPWTGCTKPGGYGFIMHKRRAVLTHRLALAGSFDALPSRDVMACHRCDNPICCNPAHLFWGDAKANNDDCRSKGKKRGAPQKIDVQTAIDMRDTGASYEAIAARFNVNQASVGKALKRAAILKALAATPSDTLAGHEGRQPEVTPSKEPIHE